MELLGEEPRIVVTAVYASREKKDDGAIQLGHARLERPWEGGISRDRTISQNRDQ